MCMIDLPITGFRRIQATTDPKYEYIGLAVILHYDFVVKARRSPAMPSLPLCAIAQNLWQALPHEGFDLVVNTPLEIVYKKSPHPT